MDLDGILLSEISQTEEDKYHIILYMVSKKMIQMNLFIRQKQTHRHKEQTCSCQGEWGWWRDGLGV